MKKPMALFSSLLPLFLLLLLLFFFFATKLLAAPLSNNPPPSRCPSFDCGNGLRLSYPFWENDKGTDSPYTCGYRDFGIRCDPNGEPVLTLPSDDYYVRDISYSDATVTLVDIDVSTEQCPRARRNLTLPILPVLDYSPLDLNLTFYFNCSSSPSDSDSLLPIECLLFGALRSYVTDQRDGDVEELNWVGLCQDKVVATVRSEEINVNGLIGGYEAALKSGFVLDWRAVRQCGACEASNGYCGYNTTAPASFLCFCDDGSARPDHCPGSNSKLALKIGIGIGCGLGGIIIGCLAFYLRRRYKGLSVRPALLSRNISSDPSSVNDSEKGGSFPGVHLFTYSELEQATNHFDSARELGDGGFGTVYYGKLRDGRAVAVKRLFEHNFKRVEQFMNEVEILAHLRHKNLVQLYGCTSRHSRELLLVYEFIQNGTVADHLHGQHAKPGGLPWPVRLKIAIETASALAYLHASDIIHRDVKTHNILLDDSFIVKVADFGLSRLFPTDVTHVSTTPQGTPGYVDPEYHQCYQLTDKSDVFSFGVVLVELISSKPAVDITRHRHEINLSNMAINKIQNRALHELVDPYLGFESDCKVRKMITAVAELAFQCLQYEKDVRPSMMEVLEALKGIENEDFNKQKAEEMDVSVEEVVLLKSGPLPLSPDSVTVKWNSSSESAASNISS